MGSDRRGGRIYPESEVRPISFDAFPTVHTLALRGSLKRPAGDLGALEAAGLIRREPDGFTLTDSGHRLHRTLSEQERARLDLGLLAIVSEPLPDAWRRVKTLEPRWNGSDAAERRRLIRDLVAIVEEVQPTLRRCANVAPRFGDYIARLREAERRLLDGQLEYAFEAAVESIATVWRELHEDFLQTLGYAQESESI
jgi:hypothetical protein